MEPDRQSAFAPDGQTSAPFSDVSSSPKADPLLIEAFALPLLRQLCDWRRDSERDGRRLPLIALNGPVGAGKSSLGRQLEALAPHLGLRLVVASIDDLYLGWPERRQRLAGNPFGVSRVPPGSHDLALLLEALSHWRQTGMLRLPRFDKTLAAGQGDRAGWRESVCDALVLEGWLMGCRPLPEPRLAALMEAAAHQQEATGPARRGAEGPLWSGVGAPVLTAEEWRWLPHWNRELAAYAPLWSACDGLWVLRPQHWGLPRRWRFQAEARQRRRGGGWLPAADLDGLVRASLCSLPPSLYQDPLLAPLPPQDRGTAVPEGRLKPVGRQKTDDLAGSGPTDGEISHHGDPAAAVAPTIAPTLAAKGKVGMLTAAEPPLQAVAWLDGRRRCLKVWRQDSPSPSSSETG